MTAPDLDATRLTRIRDRHFDFHARLAEEADAAENAGGTELRSWLELMDSEQPNIRFALEWGFDRGRPEVARLACSLCWYWIYRRRFTEGRKVLDRALRSGHISDSDRLDALLAAGGLTMEQGELETAKGRFESAQELAVAVGDRGREERAVRGLGWVYFFLNLGPPAIEAFTRALALSDDAGPVVRAEVLRGLAWSRALQDGDEPGFDLLRQARDLLESTGDRAALLQHYLVESNFLAFSTRPEEAMALAERALALSREQDDEAGATEAWLTKAVAAEQSGDREALGRILPEAMAIARRVGDRGAEARALAYRAIYARDEGDVETARAATDEALKVLQMLDELGAGDLSMRADLLMRRAELASDEGESTRAEELYRQAAGVHAGLSPLGHSATLARLGTFLIEHGDVPGGRSAWERALALADPLDETEAMARRGDLALLDGDLEASLSHRTRWLERMRTAWPKFVPAAQRKRAELLMALGRLAEAGEALDEAFAASPVLPPLARRRIHLDQARLHVMAGDAERARSDLVGIGGMVISAGAGDLITMGSTLARLALLEGKAAAALTLWSTVNRVRRRLGRVPTTLAQAFEAPLGECDEAADPLPGTPVDTVAELRRLVLEGLEGLATRS